MPNELSEVIEIWESTGEMTLNMAQVNQQLDSFIESQLEEIEGKVDDDAVVAYAGLIYLTSFLNAAISKVPSIIKKLQKYVSKFKSLLRKIGKNLGADSFSISVGLPAGISIGLSFPIPQTP